LAIIEDLTRNGVRARKDRSFRPWAWNKRPILPEIFNCIKFTDFFITCTIILFLRYEENVNEGRKEKRHTVDELCSHKTHLCSSW
jgi:hypothetical protein